MDELWGGWLNIDGLWGGGVSIDGFQDRTFSVGRQYKWTQTLSLMAMFLSLISRQ
jgi:hypothetical protein